MPGGAAGAGGLPGVQAGFTQRVQAAGRAAAGAGPSADQDRRQQDAQNLRLPHQRGIHHQGVVRGSFYCNPPQTDSVFIFKCCHVVVVGFYT